MLARQTMSLRQWVRRRFGSGAWNRWPETAYHQERYQQRLSAVQEHLAESLHLAPSGQVRIISVCAGDGRDVLGVVASHPRRSDVSAWLVEQCPQSVAAGARRARIAGVQKMVVFLNNDATLYQTYKNIAPADIVLLCGVWGHVPAAERRDLICALGSLCKPNGAIIWTRGISRGMTRLHEIQSLLIGPSWQPAQLSVTPDEHWAVATHRYCGPPAKLPDSGRIFHFRTGAGTR